MLKFEKNEQYSKLFTDVLKTGKGFNIAMNKCYILRQLISKDIEVLKKWNKFEQTLKQFKLNLDYFAIAFDDVSNKYHIAYEVSHKTLNNAPLRIDRLMDLNIPFAFIPSAIPMIINGSLDNLPIEQFCFVSNGG